MVVCASAGGQHADFGRESLQLNKDLERMTEQMENISGKVDQYMKYSSLVFKPSDNSSYVTAVSFCLSARSAFDLDGLRYCRTSYRPSACKIPQEVGGRVPSL